MNKKIIGLTVFALVAVAGFIGYTVIQNNKVEVEQAEMANDIKADKEVEATPVANQKNDDDEYVNGEPDVAVQVKDFFDKCMQYSFNVSDTANVPSEVSNFQKENFNVDYLPIINKFYYNYKKIELVKYEVKSIKETTAGYEISYVSTVRIDNKEDINGTDEKPIVAIVKIDNGKYKLVQFYTSK